MNEYSLAKVQLNYCQYEICLENASCERSYVSNCM